MHCADNRKESRGAHMQEDYPERDDKNWMKHSVAWFDGWGGKGGEVKIDYRPVHEFTLTEDVVHQAEEAGLLTSFGNRGGACLQRFAPTPFSRKRRQEREPVGQRSIAMRSGSPQLAWSQDLCRLVER